MTVPHAAMPTTVDCPADVAMSATGPIQHLCPYVDETDNGTIAIGWTCEGQTVELHSLRRYLDGFAESRISHEELVDRVAHDVRALSPGLADVTVSATFGTAGFAVEVTSAVPGDSVHSEDS